MLKGIDASADVFEYVGENLIVRGHVVIQTSEMQLTADHAVIHIPSRDVEAFGNVALIRKASYQKTIDMQEYGDLLDDVRKKVEVEEIITTPLGKRKIKVRITETTAYLQAERIAGNLNTGALKFSLSEL
jgi:lipopolysaccharide assembly outer membrane protein LptD (OstA)